jgi:hypothetical protein
MPIFTQGVQTRVLFGLLTAQSILANDATGILLPPPDVTVTLSAAAAVASAAEILAGFQVLTVTALTAGIAKGTRLLFKSGGQNFSATLVDDAITAGTAIRVQPLTKAIPNASVAAHQGLIQLVGGKSANFKIASQDDSFTTFTDLAIGQISNSLSGYKQGTIKSSEWSVDYETAVSPTDISFSRIRFAAAQASAGVLAYVRHMKQIPAGYISGESAEGYVALEGYDETVQSEGTVMVKTQMRGRGAPILKDAIPA